MIGVTHNLETINQFRLVYPSPEDIELFPGGRIQIPNRAFKYSKLPTRYFPKINRSTCSTLD